AAKEEQGKMAGRINHLAYFLEHCQIGDVPIVTVRFEGDTDTERYLLGSIEERVEGLEIVSPGSPLGEALMDQPAGATVEFASPNGSTLRVEVIAVDHLDADTE
ncbi:MAG TPA: GreA/GreB family elongation factor, partial [Acidimicrobiales bacterium]